MPNLQTLKTAPRAAAMPAKSRPGAAARVFGPVSSRRLGLSLGVDVIPRKRCTLDCLYCQLGRSARVTAARKEYAPRGVVLRQLRAALKKTGPVDWITFSGSGEPTLHSGLGAMIRAVKRMTATPVAVITNGTLLADPLVRRGLREADLLGDGTETEAHMVISGLRYKLLSTHHWDEEVVGQVRDALKRGELDR